MFCPKCGTNNPNETGSCIKCNHDFSQIPENLRVFNLHTEEATAKGDASVTFKKTEKPIKEYLVYAIIAALLGSIVFGIAALVFSGMTKAEKDAGNTEKAREYSKRTKLFCDIAIVIGAIKYLYAAVMILVMFF